jgi:signal transduction histidine kinase/CheY-like chemotaxis protein
MASARRLHIGVLAIGIAVIVGFIGEAAYSGWRFHAQIVHARNRELSNLSHALAFEAARNLDTVDGILKDCAAVIERTGAEPVTPETARRLAMFAQRSSQMENLFVTDASGHQIYRSGAGAGPLEDVSQRPYFLAHRLQPDGGRPDDPPQLSRADGVEALFVSRRINDRDGHFIGVVAATLGLDQLRQQYTGIDLGLDSSLILALSDGMLVLRQPPVAATAKPMRFRELAAMGAGAPIQIVLSHVDSRPKLISAVAVGKSSLILAVLRDEADALQPWTDEMRSAAFRTVLLTLVTLLTIAGVMRQLRRLEVAAAALRQSESRYAMAMTAANEGHAEWSLQEGTLFLSANWRALHGLDAGQHIPTLEALRRCLTIHPDDLPLVIAAVQEHFANRAAAIDVDYRVEVSNGDWRWIHSRGSCLRSADGTPTNLFCSAIDVSDRKRAEAEKATLDSRLQQTRKLEALGTLASGIAHDFNNILGAILGFGEMAQKGAEPGSALRRHVDRVMQSGERARLLVRRILDFSRSSVAEHAPVNIRGVVEEVVGMLAPTLPAGVTLDTRLDSGDAAVIGDSTQLCQVVMNVCTNAVQATRGDGVVGIALQRRSLAAPLSLLQGDLDPGDYVCIEVSDTGDGIPPEVLTRIFDPFFTTKKSGEGTGLGLSVVHGIVSSMAGAIDIVSEVGAGTRVAIWLPVAGELPAQALTKATGWPAGQGQVVMVVDDETALVELAEELLAGLGYEPVGYGSAEAALAAFTADPDRFDALLTDQALPGMSGSELAQQVLQVRPRLPILLMSGNLTEASERRALEIGVRCTLHKPLALQELSERLASLFHG